MLQIEIHAYVGLFSNVVSSKTLVSSDKGRATNIVIQRNIANKVIIIIIIDLNSEMNLLAGFHFL